MVSPPPSSDLQPKILSLPPMESLFPARRRSHLDSASYRTLVRIFSQCLSVSVNPPRTSSGDPIPSSDSTVARPDAPESSSGAQAPACDRNERGEEELQQRVGGGGAGGGALCGACGDLDELSDQNPVSRVETVSGEGVDGKSGILLSVECLQSEDINSLEGLEIGGCADGELLKGMISDLSGLINAQNDEPRSFEDSNDGQREAVTYEVTRQEYKKCEKDQNFVEEPDHEKHHRKQDEPVHAVVPSVESGHDKHHTKQDESVNCANSALTRDRSLENPSPIGLQHVNIEEPSPTGLQHVNIEATEDFIERLPKKSVGCLATTLDGSSSVTLHTVPGDLAVGMVGSEDVEEGEIPGDEQELDEYEISMDKNPGEDLANREKAKKDDQNHKHDYDSDPKFCGEYGISETDGKKDQKSWTPQYGRSESGGRKEDFNCMVSVPNPQWSPKESSEILSCQVKETSNEEGPKVDKKRKRILSEERKAKKKKTKRIKRAQKERAQGVKRLKLQPIVKPKEVKYCKFHLLGRCQQGDLCKFSHDTTPLTKSKPCKHFACGSCLKGDGCPFDHQLSKYPCHNFSSTGMCIRGDRCKFSHQIPTAESPSTSDVKKSDALLPSEKSENSNLRKQTGGLKTPVPGAKDSRRTPSNFASSSIKSIKAPTAIPKGIRFLSIGKGQSDSSDNLLAEKDADVRSSNQAHKNAENSSNRSLKEHGPHQSFKNLKENTSGLRSLQSEVSEASKILEEFLFCGSR